jgi:cysteine desulfurase
MAEALKTNYDHIVENKRHLASLEQELLNGISDLDFIRNGAESHVPGNISLSFKNADGEAILHRLDLMGICISTGSACDSNNTQISHVIKAIRVPPEYAKGTIRISLGKDNTKEDVDSIAACLTKILRKV